MVFHISCSHNKDKVVHLPIEIESNEVSFFKNDTLQEIINRIIVKNDQPKNLNIEILDFDKIQLLNIKIFDSIDDNKNIKAYYNYNNTSLIFFNYSKKLNYNSIIDVNMSLPLNECNKFIMNETDVVTDPKTYTFRIDENRKISYPNGEDLIYNNGKIKIEWWEEENN